MKILNYLNYFFVGLPVILILLGLLFDAQQGNLIVYGLFSTILTGLFQIIIGIQMQIDEPKDKYLTVYITSVVLFFITYLINVKLLNSDIIYCILLFIPLVLALFLSIIIYKKANKWTATSLGTSFTSALRYSSFWKLVKSAMKMATYSFQSWFQITQNCVKK